VTEDSSKCKLSSCRCCAGGTAAHLWRPAAAGQRFSAILRVAARRDAAPCATAVRWQGRFRRPAARRRPGNRQPEHRCVPGPQRAAHAACERRQEARRCVAITCRLPAEILWPRVALHSTVDGAAAADQMQLELPCGLLALHFGKHGVRARALRLLQSGRRRPRSGSWRRWRCVTSRRRPRRRSAPRGRKWMLTPCDRLVLPRACLCGKRWTDSANCLVPPMRGSLPTDEVEVM
jgi:hypothetical protein